MSNPIYSANYIIKLYSYSAQTLTQIATSSNIQIAAGTISLISVVSPQSPTVPFKVSLDLTINLPHFVPLGGGLTISFPTSYYSAISCANCVSNLSNANLLNLMKNSLSSLDRRL